MAFPWLKNWGVLGGMILQVAGEFSRKKCLDPEFHLTKLADMLPKESSVRDDEIETGNPTKTKRLEMTSLSSSTGPFSGANC